MVAVVAPRITYFVGRHPTTPRTNVIIWLKWFTFPWYPRILSRMGVHVPRHTCWVAGGEFGPFLSVITSASEAQRFMASHVGATLTRRSSARPVKTAHGA